MRSKTGIPIEDLHLEGVLEGKLRMADFSISPETLRHQAEIAEAHGWRQFAENLRRAAELVRVPDCFILEIYNALRPRRSDAAGLRALAERLRSDYGAPACARWVEDADAVYARHGLLK